MKENYLMSMKQFAEYTGTTPSTLRYYDTIGLFSPAKRGDNNYRYYSPRQIITINLINVLAKMNIPLSRIAALTRKRSPSDIIELLRRHDAYLADEIRRIHETRDVMHTFQTLISAGLTANEKEFEEREIEETAFFPGPENDFSGCNTFYEPFFNFCKYAKTNNINLAYPVGGYFSDMDVFTRRTSQPERFISINPGGSSIKEAGLYLVAHTRGYYGEMNDAAQRLHSYAAKGLRFAGPVYVIYLHDEISLDNPNRYLAQISVAVKQN
jgi:DNA-binding transcriptional MerR regulator